MNEREIVDQLHLAMSILSGRHGMNYTQQEVDLLRLQPFAGGDNPAFYAPMPSATQIAAEEILSELILYALGMAQKAAATPPDPKLLAVALIEEIKGAGGTLPRSRVHLPPDFLIALAEDFIIRIDGSNLVLGRNAERALRDMEQK